MSVLAMSLLEKIEGRRARTGVVGLGYVGLPLAVELAKAGFHTTGIDLDDRKVQTISEGGRSYIDPRFIELAGHVNAGMPHYVVDKVVDALSTRRKAINGSKILIAGVAYKRDIDDMRESPALDVMGLLHAKGATVDYADPYVPELHRREWSGGFDVRAVELRRGTIGHYDCVVIVTDHTTFDYEAIVAEADVVVDTRNAIKTSHANVFRLGAPRPDAQGADIAVA